MVATGDRRMNGVAADPAKPDSWKAREQLATWLAENSDTPEACTVESLEGWDTMQVDEWLMFDPPGFADHVFLVADGNVFDFAPSEQTLDEALAAARNVRDWDAAGRGDAVNRSSHKS